MPDATEIIRKAGESGSGGWEPMMVAFILIASIVAISWLVKVYMAQANKREDSMAARINTLEDYQRATLATMIEKTQTALVDNSTAIRELRDTLEGKPCLLTEERSDRLVDRIANRVKDQVQA